MTSRKLMVVPAPKLGEIAEAQYVAVVFPARADAGEPNPVEDAWIASYGADLPAVGAIQ